MRIKALNAAHDWLTLTVGAFIIVGPAVWAVWTLMQGEYDGAIGLGILSLVILTSCIGSLREEHQEKNPKSPIS